jgi:hypothetical protein
MGMVNQIRARMHLPTLADIFETIRAALEGLGKDVDKLLGARDEQGWRCDVDSDQIPEADMIQFNTPTMVDLVGNEKVILEYADVLSTTDATVGGAEFDFMRSRDNGDTYETVFAGGAWLTLPSGKKYIVFRKFKIKELFHGDVVRLSTHAINLETAVAPVRNTVNINLVGRRVRWEGVEGNTGVERT